jgi:hypothetical protein
MKKILSLLLVLVTMLAVCTSLVACGGAKPNLDFDSAKQNLAENGYGAHVEDGEEYGGYLGEAIEQRLFAYDKDDNYGYETFHFGHSLIYASNPIYSIADDVYINGLVLPNLKANIYNLSKLAFENTHMMIELFLNDNNINFAISDDSPFDSLVNKTNIIVGQKSNSEGHSIIIIDLQKIVGD